MAVLHSFGSALCAWVRSWFQRSPAPVRLETVLALSSGWYWETDEDHRFRQFVHSPRYVPMSASGLIGRARWELSGVDPLDPRWAKLRSILDHRESFNEFTYSREHAPGVSRHFLLNGEPVFDRGGRFRGYRGLGREVTAQREAEDALSATEAQLAAIIDAAADAIVTVDAQMRVVVFNESAGRMFGCGRSQALGEPMARFVPGCDELAADFTRRMRPSSSPCTLARGLPVTGRRGGGQDFPAEVSLTRIEAGGRELYCFILRDLSEWLAAERAREELQAQLRQSQKMEAVGTLAGGIAHDFNNIIGAILGNVSLARESVDASHPGAQFLSEISRAGLRARELVQRILAFCRKQEPVFLSQPLQPLIEESVQLLRAMVPTGIDIVTDLPLAPLHVRADMSQLQQVLMNLAANAWQAIGPRAGRITISLAEAGPQLRLSVSDTGCGIDPALLPRIFDPFFTTKPKGEGTGLGLAVVHGIVRSHGGRIEVHSRPGDGTTFELWLPSAPAAEHAPRPSPAPAPLPARGNGQHVVFVDDYPAMVLMVTTTLEARGWRATGFDTVPAALQYLARNAATVDAVVTDYNMPGASGLEFARQLRELRPGLPVLLASGLVTDELRSDALAAGVRHVFDKAGGVDGICEAIARLLPDVPRQEA